MHAMTGCGTSKPTLVDTKSRDFPLASGLRAAGDPVHATDPARDDRPRLNIVDAEAESNWVPYPGYCDTIGPAYGKLVGLNLLQDFRRHLQARLGGVHGCTHLTELANVLPTAAVQAFAGEVFQTRDARMRDTMRKRRRPSSWTAATRCASTVRRSRSSIRAGHQPKRKSRFDRETDSDQGRKDA